MCHESFLLLFYCSISHLGVTKAGEEWDVLVRSRGGKKRWAITGIRGGVALRGFGV